MIDYIIIAALGTLYGTLIGVIPIAGVTTALITVFAIGSYFLSDPYLGLVFLTSIVASCAAADSYTSILTGIPGASTTAACVIDGYPMARNGEGSRAIGIAIADSFINGVLFAVLTFSLLPVYSKIILYVGTPEFAALMVLSLSCVGFIASNNILKSVVAISLGLYLGLTGQDPGTGIERFTFGWDYLEVGIGMIPLMSGLFGIPELVYNYPKKGTIRPKISDKGNYKAQLLLGFKDVWKYKIDSLRGGLIGFISGLLPGVGGAVGDFLAYGATKAAHPNEKFGTGIPLGLAGCEGANSAQKVSSMIPTMLFGIPAAPFAAMVMAIAMYFGIELGTPDLLYDEDFIFSMSFGYMFGTIGVALISVFLFKYIVRILDVPFWIYATSIVAIIIYANLQYTGGWEDLAILGLMTVVGLFCKHFDINRPAVLITFVVAERLENYTQQTSKLYDISDLFTRPLFVIILIISVLLVALSLKRSYNSYIN